jgi:hypothetical protein
VIIKENVMEQIYVLPLQILAVIVTATIIALIVRHFRKKRKKKLQTGESTPRMGNAEKNEYEDYNSDFPIGI